MARRLIELATERHRAARTELLVKILETLPVEPYDLAVAEAHGHLLAQVHREGVKRGAHDLIIAATAVATRSYEPGPSGSRPAAEAAATRRWS